MNKISVGKKPDKTDWHRLWGMMVFPLFERLGCTVILEMDLFAKVQRLDMTVVTWERPLCFDHPILGLLSNDVEQILKSRHRLESDGWLLEYVSFYLRRLST